MTDETPPLPLDTHSSWAAPDAQAGDEHERALAAIAARKDKVEGKAADSGEHSKELATAEPARPKKKRFGQPANAPRKAPKPRKRKSRWECAELKSDSKALIVQTQHLWPTDVTLPGGITVRSACTRICIRACPLEGAL